MKQERKIGLGIVYGIFFSLTCILLLLWILPKLYLIAQWMNLIDFSHTFEQYMGFIFSEDVPFVCFCVAPAGILIGVIASNHRYTIKRNFIAGGIIGFVMGFLIEEFLIMLALIPAGPRLKPYFMIVIVMTIGLAVAGVVATLAIRPSNEVTFSNVKKQSWVKWSLIILGVFGVTIVVFAIVKYVNAPLKRVAFFNPSLTKNSTLFVSPSNITINDNYAYVTDFDNGLSVLDITQPNEPHLIGHLETGSESFRNIVIEDNYAYVTTLGIMYTGQLAVIDISDPTNPDDVHLGNQGGWRGLDVADGYIYVAGYEQGGLRVIDISNPNSPTQVSHLKPANSNGRVMDVAVSDKYAYAILGDVPEDENHGLWIVDISDPVVPTEVSFLPSILSGHKVVADKDHLYVLNEYGKVDVFDISTSLPRKVSSLETNLFLGTIVVEDDYLYVCGDWALQVFDVSNPEKPALVDKYWVSSRSAHSSCEDMAVKDNYIYWLGKYKSLFSSEEQDKLVILESNFHRIALFSW